ncbi:specific rna polymerase ii transcription factor [Favolaschia claudopus]|uniref:Specific rna polymerase ii transcription factor n=1 Tax=Favolaschia claudopus TaxID=2862362 RepID=A0AAW0AB05_9AGAR
MSNRRRMSLQSNPYPSEHWNDQPNSPTMNDYSSPYSATSQPPMSSYRGSARPASASYSPDGYYPAAQSSASSQPVYASGSGSNRSQYRQDSYPSSYGHQQHSSHSHSHPQPYAQPYGGHSPTSPHSPPSRSRSHSVYVPQHSAPIMAPHPQYPQQVPLNQAGSYSEYASSATRPFSCDMCALSFNRQHDLKRHRETHTGEKPFLCNGGCGKTFTRKDALKRHQLVKGCGKVEEAWP